MKLTFICIINQSIIVTIIVIHIMVIMCQFNAVCTCEYASNQGTIIGAKMVKIVNIDLTSTLTVVDDAEAVSSQEICRQR